MISRDYTKEVGIPSHKKSIPRPIAFAILAVVAVGVSFGIAGVVDQAKEHSAAEKAASSPTAAAAPAIPAADSAAAK